MLYPIFIFCRLSRRRRLEISLSGKSSSAAKKKADNFEQLRKEDHPLSGSAIRVLFKVFAKVCLLSECRSLLPTAEIIPSSLMQHCLSDPSSAPPPAVAAEAALPASTDTTERRFVAPRIADGGRGDGVGGGGVGGSCTAPELGGNSM